MKLVELKCKNCGADLTIEEDKNAKCPYCQAKFKFDDEVKHIQYDNMEQSGYDFEKGRIRARQENQAKSNKKGVELGVRQGKKVGCFFCLLCLILFPFLPFIITYYVLKSSKFDKKKKIIILSILWGLIIVCGVASSKEAKDLAEKPWATECTSIHDFEYYLDEEEIILKKYNGTDKRVKICSTYQMNEKKYKITKFSEPLFFQSNVYSVILPDSLTTMPNNTFNTSGIRYVYIPENLKVEKGSYSFYRYFHDVEKIYYGGTKEQWKELIGNANREDIDAKEIIYEAKSSDLK